MKSYKMQVLVVLSVVLALIIAAPGVNSDEIPSTFRRMIANCMASEDTMSCLSIKAIMALQRAARTPKIDILPGVSIRRDSNRSAETISENEIIDSLPVESSERSGHLFDLAIDSLVNFFDSHSLEIKFPTESSQFFGRAIEGRKKKKKMLPALALALAAKALGMALWSKFCKGGGHKGHYVNAGYVKVVGAGANEAGAAQTELSPSPSFAEQYLYDRGYDSGQDLAYNAYYAH